MRALDDRPGSHVNSDRPIRYVRNRPGRVVTAIAALTLCACSDDAARPPHDPGSCIAGGYLTTQLHGAVTTIIDWRGDTLNCEGMPRPAGEGARLRLAGPLDGATDTSVAAFILGIPDLQRGRTARELATHVTFLEEGRGRFFATADTQGCWTDIDTQDPLDDNGGTTYRIGGTVYCVSPLAELNGASSINFTELTFSARLNWSPPE